GAALQEGVDLADVALLDLEHLGDLPGVRLHRAGHYFAPVGRLEAARLATGMVEEAEREHDAALLVDGHKTPVADAVHEGHQAGFDLLGAAPLARIRRGGRWIRPCLARRRRRQRGLAAILVAQAIRRERIVPLAVVLLQAGERFVALG